MSEAFLRGLADGIEEGMAEVSASVASMVERIVAEVLAEAERQAAPVPDPDPVPDPEPTPTPDPDPTPTPDPDPVPGPTVVGPLTLVGNHSGIHVRGVNPADETGITLDDGATLSNSLIEDVAQGVFWANDATLTDVVVDGWGGMEWQAHALYGRHGVLTRVGVRNLRPDSAGGSCSFHAYAEGVPVNDLTWVDCWDESATDAVILSRQYVDDVTIDGFRKPAGKLLVGHPARANRTIDFQRLDIDVLQLDGTWTGGRVAGRAKRVARNGGVISLAALEAAVPQIDFSGLTVG